MSLRFHNHLTKSLDDFSPLKEGQVSLYVCGPTVYSSPTIGNWVSYIYWDTLVRVLKASGLSVNHVMNITDVGHLVSDGDDGDDKIQKGARRDGKTAWEVAEQYESEFVSGMKLLNLLPPSHMPKATDYIEQQLELVRKLQQKGYTYQINDGIYFDTEAFPNYAFFAPLNLDSLKAGARVEFNPEKRHPSDFALWKFTPEGEHRDMEWTTPPDLLVTSSDQDRKGFPGWHLECSAMAMALLGETLDIHTGGIDHIPVHHTNEIAQSEAATGKQFSRFWLHNNHLKVDGTKISKSLGNGYTLQDLADKGFSPLDLRMFVLQSHYRTEGNFTFENLNAARRRLLNWRNVAALRHQTHDTLQNDRERESDSKTVSLYAASQALTEALSNDLDTPSALAIVDEAFSQVLGHGVDDIHQHALESFLTVIDDLLGLKLIETTPDISDDQKKLIIERSRAREEGDYKSSDIIRDKLLKDRLSLRDTSNGVIWEYSD